jgi:hypothetical protein
MTKNGKPDKNYRFEVVGFLNFARFCHLTLEEARALYKEKKAEVYLAYQGGEMRPTQWQSWELYQNNDLIAEGDYPYKYADVDTSGGCSKEEAHAQDEYYANAHAYNLTVVIH